jgi:hypothetical protein
VLVFSVRITAAEIRVPATSPVLKISVTTLSFGDQQATTSSPPQTVTVTNAGTVPVTLQSIAVTGSETDDFSQSNNCGESIAALASCKIQVIFTPVSAGAKSTRLSITDSAAHSPQVVALTGQGVVPVFGVNASKLTISAAPTDPAPYSSIGVTVKNPGTASVFYSAKFTGPALTGVDIQMGRAPANGLLSGVAEFQVDQPALQGSGTFVSTVILNACLDSACTKPLAGSPQKVTVTYVVTGNAIPAGDFGLLPTSLNIETPSNGQTAPSIVDLTAYDLPPYPVHVTYKSRSSKAIRSMSFSGFPSTGGYGDGQLTVNFALPGQLGPGIYNDTITLSVCYDTACKKPAIGSPWLIPVVYTVTASLGREFDQRIVSLSAVSIAADPSGNTIYVADWEYSQASQANLVKLNPATGAIVSSAALDGNPGRLAISADGQYGYVAVTLAATATQEIERVKLATMTVDLRIPFPVFGSAIWDLAVSPVDSRALAVTYYYIGQTTGPFVDVGIFDDGVERPKVLSTVAADVYSTNIQWRSDGTQLYIRGSENMSVSAVESDGLAAASPLLALVYGDGFYNAAIHESNGLLYSDGGGVFDPNTRKVLGHYLFATPMSDSEGGAIYADLEPDSSTGLTFAAYFDSGIATIPYTLQSFHLAGFNPVWIARFPVAISSPVRWGADGLALIGLNEDPTGGQFSVYLIHGSFVTHEGMH